MAITYCLVANRHCVLAEAEENQSKGSQSLQIAHKLVHGLDFDKNEREALDCNGNTFSYLIDNGLAVVCVTDTDYGQSSAILFLKHIKRLFDQQFGERGKATKLKLDMNMDFGPVLAKNLREFSSSDGLQKLDQLRQEMDNVKDSMQQNIGKVLERGDKIELLVDKSDNLNTQSMEFAKSSRALRRHLWWQNVKLMICCGVIVTVGVGALFYYWKK